jgi:threonyl-tRNA synthetase
MPKCKNKIEIIRHSLAHIMAHAVQDLFPAAKKGSPLEEEGVKFGIGPVIENGFYYDFDLPKDISQTDLEKIEKRMKEIIKKNVSFKKRKLSQRELVKTTKNQPYKKELIKELKKDKITFYESGDFIDLCKGPHVKSTKEINPDAFKLTKIAGAYWRGDEKNKMLTRIYGIAFDTKKELDNYLKMQKEAEKRDHRILGKKLGLYAIYPEIGAGLPVWLPKGYRIRKILEDYMVNLERKYGYEHMLTPHIGRDYLFKTSGHLDFYKESMYSPIKIDKETYYLKPMNCPMAIIVYKSEPRSYRDLPIKWGEFGTVYRYEKSGELSGLIRVRGFTQNDAHIFCTPEQLLGQFLEVFETLKIFYRDLGFKNYKFRLGLGDPEKEKYKYCGNKKAWEHAEKTIEKALKKTGSEYYKVVGEAAFYGPKLDVQAVDSLGREESVSTIQIDFNLPEKFGMEYINSKGEKKQPFVIHRALIGSFERFFGFLIEHFAGDFPLWLSPEQIWVIPVGERHVKYAKEVGKKLSEENLSVVVRTENESVGKKIRNGEMQKIPYLLVVGDKEIKEKSVSPRFRGKDLGKIKLTSFIKRVKTELKNKK